tara:strand:- start:1195 stop:1407 length:213 start_codon:yes stop_codon:yes gene_type:complete
MSQTTKPENLHDYTRWRKNKKYRVVIDYVPSHDYFQFKILHDGEIKHYCWGYPYYNAVKYEIQQWLQING